jgi:L-asparaginase II
VLTYSQRHVIAQVSEADLRLDHPELRQVASGVGVLGAKAGAEGVHVGERAGVGLHVELSGDGEAGAAAEEVLAEVHLAGLLVHGQLAGLHVVRHHGGHAELLTGTFAVGSRDQRGVHVHEPAVVEELHAKPHAPRQSKIRATTK